MIRILDCIDKIMLGEIMIKEIDNQINPVLSDMLYEQMKKLYAVNPDIISSETKTQIRNLLRNGRYSPTGRGKPASEYLVHSYIKNEARMNSINPMVDLNNYFSFKCGFPISIIDQKKIKGSLSLRLGTALESYVFNQSGHEIKLQDLIILSDDIGPFASPVKDSMRCKCYEDCTVALGVIYTTRGNNNEKILKQTLEEWRQISIDFLKAKKVEIAIY